MIYADDKDVLTRAWNHRDADRTKVTEEFPDVILLAEHLDAAGPGTLLDGAVSDLAEVAARHAVQVEVTTVRLGARGVVASLPSTGRVR